MTNFWQLVLDFKPMKCLTFGRKEKEQLDFSILKTQTFANTKLLRDQKITKFVVMTKIKTF